MGSAINLKLGGGGRPAQQSRTGDTSAIEMERRIITIRWLAILVSTGALPFLKHPQSPIPLLILIALGAVYNLTIQLFLLPRRPGWLTRGYVSAIGDFFQVSGGLPVLRSFPSRRSSA